MTVIVLPSRTSLTEPGTYTLNLPEGLPLLNSNRGPCRNHSRRLKREDLARVIAEHTRRVAFAAGIPRLDAVEITGIYHPQSQAVLANTRAANWEPTLNAAITGLRRAGVLAPGHTRIAAQGCRIGDLAGRAFFQITLGEVAR